MKAAGILHFNPDVVDPVKLLRLVNFSLDKAGLGAARKIG